MSHTQAETVSIRFNEPYLTGNELGYLQQVLESGHFAGNGPFTSRVQDWLSQRHGCPLVLLTHSCTAALEMSALLLDIQPGDEVIVPSFTFVSTATAFLRAGATVVFCEIDPTTMTMDAADAARRVTPRTRAIVPVHYGGVGADMAAVQALADAHDLQVIEDAAQGLDARRDGRILGTMGALATFSFHETKNLHCGLGGALYVNDAALADRAWVLWERGTNRRRFFKGQVDKYSWVDLGSSFYPSELQAAFLLAQLEGLDRNTSGRERVWRGYAAGLADLAAAGDLKLPLIPDSCVSNYHAFSLRMNSPAQADAVRGHLNGLGVQAVIHYVPLHDSPMGQKLGYAPEDLPVTRREAGSLLRLPLHHGICDADVARVVQAVRAATRACPI